MPNQFNHSTPALAPPPLDSEEAAAGSHPFDKSTEAKPQDFERRSEARYPAQDAAEIEIMPGPGKPIYGTVLDVSRSGLRIALPKRIDRGQQVKVTTHHNVIFGEVRYCRAVSGGFDAGLRIQDLVRPAGWGHQHIAEDPLAFYAVGKGLSVIEVIEVREHLVRCEACRVRLAEQEAALNPTRRTVLRHLYPRD